MDSYLFHNLGNIRMRRRKGKEREGKGREGKGRKDMTIKVILCEADLLLFASGPVFMSYCNQIGNCKHAIWRKAPSFDSIFI
jgi:hypothetical protein